MSWSPTIRQSPSTVVQARPSSASFGFYQVAAHGTLTHGGLWFLVDINPIVVAAIEAFGSLGFWSRIL